MNSESDILLLLTLETESEEAFLEAVSIIAVLSGFCIAIKLDPLKREAVKKTMMNNK